MATIRALDDLGRPEISSRRVRSALDEWKAVAARPVSVLSASNNDAAEFGGPFARNVLEAALCALPHRRAAPLRAAVAPADAAFAAKTLDNPRADPSLPWWSRRAWS